MNSKATIGIIGGCGWLGSAIATSAIARGVIDADRLVVSGHNDKREQAGLSGARWTTDNSALAAGSDVVMLSVPPAQFPDIQIEAAGKLVISVMAGISAQKIADQTGAEQVIRSIPNAAAGIQHSFTPWFATPEVSGQNKQFVQALFDACGGGAEVSEERHIDYCVAMTGSGAAFPALLAEALIEHAVGHGLPQDFAESAAKGVLTEASQLFAGRQGQPAEIVQTLIDYQGTTAAALLTMREGGFNQVVGSGLEAALEKAKELGGS